MTETNEPSMGAPGGAGEDLADLPPMVRESHPVAPPRPPSGRLAASNQGEYEELYRRSIENPGEYWSAVANEFEWFAGWPASPAVTGDLAQGFEYFPGAMGNVSVNCVDRHARATPDKVAVHWFGEDGTERSWTYARLLDETARFAQALVEMGVTKGDVVAIFLPNLLETFAVVQGCLRIGAIYNIIFSGFSPDALADRIVDTGAKVVVTADETYRRGKTITLKRNLDEVLGRLDSVEHVVVVRRSANPEVPMLAPRDRYYDELLAATTSLAEPVALEANETGFIIYTSGTSAKPKGLVHSGLGFMVGAYHNMKLAVDLGPDDVYWCTADCGWLAFPIFEIVGATALGATMIACEGALDYPGPERFYSILENHRVNKVFSAPTVVRMLARYGEGVAERYDLSALELLALVGEPLDANTWHWADENLGRGSLEINNTYGQSETGSAWTASMTGVTPAKPGSCGPALPGHAYQILDEYGEPVTPGTTGYLTMTAPFPTMFRGIWHDPERYRAQYFTRFGADRYDTADAAIQDEDGHLWVVGRVDDVINVAAHRLSTMEMESALLSVPGVVEAAVIGVNDPIKGQVPEGFVTLGANADDSITEELLAQHLVDAIGTIARPRRVHIMTTMPRTRSGKIVRRLLRELVVDGVASGDVSGLEDPEVLAQLESELAH
ncbi:MAG TPA: acetate--CoA ligase [Acidimicrobiales bacterium]|nr:acetate--CoA ligase [Acidimicrobiales bacterium]